MKLKIAIYFAVSLSFLFVQCQNNVTIADIKKNPQRFEDKTISVSGTVQDYGIVALGNAWRSFLLDDGSGSIVVRTKRTILPKSGTQMTIKGELEDVTIIGLILNEK